jgi:thiol-disulfide isomerase/thioredoxin
MITSALVAALAVVGALTVANLLLTFGVIRRLREHAEQLAERPAGGSREMLIGVGAAPDDFVAMTTAAEPVSRASIAGGQLVGFFTPGCAPCEELAPRFLDRAMTTPGGRERVLAVVVAEPEEAADTVRLFEPVAKVVVEPRGGGVEKAFGVRAYPAVCLLGEDGTVLDSGLSLIPAAELSPSPLP